MPSTLAQSKERKGSNFAIWQPCPSIPYSLSCFHLAAELSRTLMKVGRCCSVDEGRKERKREGRVSGRLNLFIFVTPTCYSATTTTLRTHPLTHSPSFSFRLPPLFHYVHYIQELNTCARTSVRACLPLAKSPSVLQGATRGRLQKRPEFGESRLVGRV